ncbi:MAG: hypothetical protein P8I39_03050, partial [Akkermansiaceae bacterium]|nr:hypothetical protein [Akkermansiaceae bacterium]
MTFDSLFPLLACFSGEGHGVFKPDDFDLLDSAPDDEPSVTEDGTYGATFSFSKAAAGRIAAITTSNQDKWLVAMLNGRPVDAVYIDKPVGDGRLVIWRGIKQVEIIRFEYAMPLTGETSKQWKERIKGHERQ